MFRSLFIIQRWSHFYKITPLKLLIKQVKTFSEDSSKKLKSIIDEEEKGNETMSEKYKDFSIIDVKAKEHSLRKKTQSSLKKIEDISKTNPRLIGNIQKILLQRNFLIRKNNFFGEEGFLMNKGEKNITLNLIENN
jgi:hypothetical protein